ncbi:MAG: hypothetical protein HZC22_13285 [Rhodocyclales bacterium]|nr:hypothetical protein [Rhodocyclales bacterium]
MDWKSLIADLQGTGMSQTLIGAALGKSQAWVCAVAAGKYVDLKWSDGEALRRLHAAKVSSTDTPEERRAA